MTLNSQQSWLRPDIKTKRVETRCELNLDAWALKCIEMTKT